MTYICNLQVESPCKFIMSDGVHCQGNKCCAFCKEEILDKVVNGYERKERWYEKYYK